MTDNRRTFIHNIATRITKTATPTSSKTFRDNANSGVFILKLRNKATTQTTKSYDYLCNGATQQSVLAFLILCRISYISSITNFVHFIGPQNSVLG